MKSILFVQEPNEDSKLLKSPRLMQHYRCIKHTLTTREAFLEFLGYLEKEKTNIVAIYGGFAAFTAIGGLTNDIIESDVFPLDTLRCIVLCSRGYNGFDLECLQKYGIALYNYQDTVSDDNLPGFKAEQVGNDVADCALWHVLEGFRKFSYQQSILRQESHTIRARARNAGYDNLKRFAFGHQLPKGLFAESPRGKKCLILGLGSIGKQIALKLQYGLGMEIHYSKRSASQEIEQQYGWKFHTFDKSLLSKEVLYQFSAIIIALPGTSETHHFINKEFLSCCNGPDLILVNIGRGSILDMEAINEAIETGTLRHLGTDVFHDEPLLDSILKKDNLVSTTTPHIGSATVDVFQQSTELALMNIIQSTNESTNDKSTVSLHCRVI